MSIVAVHGPYTFGSRTVYNALKTVQGFAITADGTKWRFIPTDESQPAANYDWAWSHTSGTAGGSPASLADTMIAEFTFPAGSVKSVVLTLNGVAQGAVAATVPAAGQGPSPMMAVGPGEDGEEVESFASAQIPEEVPEEYDPGAHTVNEVEQYVTDNPDSLEEVYEAEIAGRNRSTLVTWLEEQFPYDPAEWTVQEVVDYATANPDQLDDIIAAEQAGKNRTTLVTQLESLR